MIHLEDIKIYSVQDDIYSVFSKLKIMNNELAKVPNLLTFEFLKVKDAKRFPSFQSSLNFRC